MSVFSICLGRIPCSWINPLMQVMFLVLGLFGLVLLRLRLLMLISSVVDPFLAEVWSLAGVVHCFGSSGLVVTRFGRLVVMLLMPTMLLMFSCIVILLLPPSQVQGGDGCS